MSTQLRLLTNSEIPRPARSERRAAAGVGDPETPARPLRARRIPASRGRTRRPVHWQEQWRLDSRTRAVGRAGVASARAALARAVPDGDGTGLRQAS